MASIRLQGITKTFGKNRALRNLSFQVDDGEFFCILGPPGAGNSTLSNRVSQKFLASSETVGFIAVDPTSPFSGWLRFARCRCTRFLRRTITAPANVPHAPAVR